MNFSKFYSQFWKRGLRLRGISQQMTSNAETKITEILRQHFPKASEIKVMDISGGCGAMFEIHVHSIEFKDMNRVKQHMTVNEALKNQIKDMHGIRIFTALPKD